MAVAIVQSKLAASSGAGTVSARTNGVLAQNTLLTLAIQAAGAVPPPPGDSSSDAFTIIDQNFQGRLNMAYSVYCALRSAGGNEVTSVSVSAASQLVVAELSGVATPAQVPNAQGRLVWNPDVPDGIASGQAGGVETVGTTLYTAAQTGGLGFALLCASGNPVITCTAPSWTATASGTASTLAVTYDLRTLAYTGPGALPISWTLSSASDVLVVCFGMPAA